MRSLDNQILKLLSNNDVTFFIPPYQRNYEWDTDMCEVLLGDIERVAMHGNTQHFFGTVIFYAESTQLGQPDKYILVDGQQRLTTTMLFLIAAREVLADEKLSDIIDSKYLRNNNVEGDVEYKIKLKQVESDWDAYKNIILGNQLEERDKRTRVYVNYRFFKDRLAKLDQDKVLAMVDKGLSNFNIVTIQLYPDQNPWEKPQEIFESMNSLGKPLSLADLVRNFLLLGKTSRQQEDLYHRYWLRIERNLFGNSSSFTVSSFIRDYMQLVNASSYKKATEVNYKELYRDFKNLFNDANHEELIATLASYSDIYGVLAGYRSSGHPEVDAKINDLKTVESSSFYSFFMGVLKLLEDEKINEIECHDILDAVFKYVTRRRILRLTTAENKSAPVLVRYLDKIVSSNNKKSKMLEILSNQPYALRLPNDSDIRGYLLGAESNFYNLKVGKFLQSLIEERLTKNRPALNDKFLQVEHIMPQTLSKNWQEELGSGYSEIHEKYLNNIGNLTLIRHNQELGNDPFDAKKEIYMDHAGLQIAKSKITDQPLWGEEQIKERAIFLVDLLLNDILLIDPELRTSNNYTTEKRNVDSSRRLSFEKLGLIGESLYFVGDSQITAQVVGDKELLFEGESYRLSPLTALIMSRKDRLNGNSGYWGVNQWGYQGQTLYELMNDEIVLGENEALEAEDELHYS